jgi:hypothetical protein
VSYLNEFDQAMQTTPDQLAEREARRRRGAAMWQAHLDRIGHQVTYRQPKTP